VIGFVIGLFVGALIGVGTMALCCASSKEVSEQKVYPSHLEGSWEFDTDTGLLKNHQFYNKMAYSKYFRSYIRVVEFQDTLHWKFVLCNERGYATSSPETARASVFEFAWKEIDHGL